jgi:hypothetical protein
MAVEASFRGIIGANELNGALAAAAIPEELRLAYVDVQRPMLSFRTLPNMVKLGIMTQSEAEDYIRRLGYSDPDANRIIKLALPKAAAPAPAQADALHGLTQTTVLSLYDAGTLDNATAAGLLESTGIGVDAAALSLQLHDLNNQAAERKAASDAVVAQATVGQLSYDEAQSQLFSLGLTSAEVNKATAALDKALLVKVKLPSEDKLLAMYKAGLLGRADVVLDLQSLGYSSIWAELVVKLSEVKPDASTAA